MGDEDDEFPLGWARALSPFPLIPDRKVHVHTLSSSRMSLPETEREAYSKSITPLYVTLSS